MDKKTTAAQLKAVKKYDKVHYKAIACKCKLSDYEKYLEYAATQKINSMSGLLNKAVKYCIENDVQLKSDKLNNDTN